MARALLACEGSSGAFERAKVATVRVYGDHILTKVPGLRDAIVEGSAGVTGMALEAY
jgi:hypothetical protein